MRIKINREQPFQVLATNFSIGPSSSGYDLQISADGVNFTTLFSVGANVTRMVTGVANGSTYRLQYNTDEDVIVNWERQCNDGGSGGSGSGGTDPAMVQQMIDASLSSYSADLKDGNPIVGMSKQLYSPDGVTSEGTFNYRTTGGEESVATGDAELREVGGNMSYSELKYNDSAALERGGEPVTGFTADFEWGDSMVWSDMDSSTRASLKPLWSRWKFTNNQGYVAFNIQYGQYNTETFSLKTTSTGVQPWTGVMPSTITIVDENQWIFETDKVKVDIVYDGEWTIAHYLENKTGNPNYTYMGSFGPFDGAEGVGEYGVGSNIPNDIPVGESTYAYTEATSAWTPSLPQAITDLKIDGVDYVPEDGDEITINREVYKEGTAVVPAPTKFVALGFNSFSKDGDTDISSYTEDNGVYSVAVYAVAGLSDGYVVYSQNSGITAAGIGSGSTAEADTATTTYGAAVSIVYPTAEKPYILVTTTDIEGLCIHPRWSGIKDEEYAEYSKSEVAIDFNSDCPLYAVGSVRNTWNLVNGEGTMAVTREAYTAARVEELLDAGKVIGTDFDFDANYIYVVAATASTVALSISNYSYKDNDFSVEYFVDANGIIPVGVKAETWYMNNLVDKLRNMQGLEHLDNLNGTGNEGTIYECDSHLWTWNSNSGVCAEWNDSITQYIDSPIGFGLIFSHIPDGQTILGFRYRYNNKAWRYIKMSGNTLVLTEEDGTTIVNSCTYGQDKKFEGSYAGGSYYVNVRYQKHYLGVEIKDTIETKDVWSGTAAGGHFEIVDHTNYPYILESNNGIPNWNSKGEIIGKKYSVDVKAMYANNTGYSNSTNFMVQNAGSFPNRMFVPTQSGVAGQVLLSAGNGEPQWSNWIKCVKITSDAYEALQDKDPNTLYLIDDE